MKTILAIIVLLAANTATAGGFRSFCGNRVVVQRAVVVQSVPTLVSPIYYVPQTPYRQASYSSQAEVQAKQDARDAKFIALAVAEALKQLGGPQARAQAGSAALSKCSTCHGPDQSQADKFVIPLGEMSATTAVNIKYGIESKKMAEKAKLTDDEVAELLRDTTEVIRTYFANAQPTAVPLPVPE